jgi:hypothetical protein
MLAAAVVAASVEQDTVVELVTEVAEGESSQLSDKMRGQDLFHEGRTESRSRAVAGAHSIIALATLNETESGTSADHCLSEQEDAEDLDFESDPGAEHEDDLGAVAATTVTSSHDSAAAASGGHDVVDNSNSSGEWVRVENSNTGNISSPSLDASSPRLRANSVQKVTSWLDAIENTSTLPSPPETARERSWDLLEVHYFSLTMY